MKKAMPCIFAAIIILNIVCVAFVIRNVSKKKSESAQLPKSPNVVPVQADVEENYDESIKELTEQINSIIDGKKGIWSVYVKNLENGMTVEINDHQFIAASVIKLYNMVTVYNEVENGNLEMTEFLKSNIEQMITVSSNSSSNTVVMTIGGGNFAKGAEKVNSLATELGCENTYEQHMLYDDIIPSYGRNRTSVRDCGIILEKLYWKQCVSPEYDEEMLELLKNQTRDFKIPAKLPDGTVVANKTGENSNVESDVGIVFSPECDYVICISVEKYGETKPRDTIAEISECIYNFFNSKEL